MILNIFSCAYLPSVCAFLVKWLFMSFTHFLIELLAFLLLGFEYSLYICSRYKSFVRYIVCKWFLLVCIPSFHPLNRVFVVQEILILMMPVYKFFSFMNHALNVKCKKSLALKIFSYVFPKSFMLSRFISSPRSTLS